MAIALSHHISSVLNTLNSLANKINWKILKVINSARKTIDPFEMIVICSFFLLAFIIIVHRVLINSHTHSSRHSSRTTFEQKQKRVKNQRDRCTKKRITLQITGKMLAEKKVNEERKEM